MPRHGQRVMTSATWPKEVDSLAKRFLKKPIVVKVGELDLKCVETVEQRVIKVTQDDKKFKVLMDNITEIRRENEAKVDEEDEDNDDEDSDDDEPINLRPVVYQQPEQPPEEQNIEQNGWGSDGGENGGDENQGNGWDDPIAEDNNGEGERRGFSKFTHFEDNIFRKWKMIVFCSMKVTVDEVFRKMREARVPDICKMHGDHEQVKTIVKLYTCNLLLD